MALNFTLTASVGTLTLTAQPADTETVTVGGKVYTFQTTLTDSDGNVNIGSTAANSLLNLQAAINFNNAGESAVSAGTDYAASMTINPEVEVTSSTATTMVVTALTPGTVGDLIASTETITTGGAWGAATLASGAGNVDGWAASLLALNQINGEVVTHIRDDLTTTAD